MTHLTHQMAGLVGGLLLLTLFPVSLGPFLAMLAIIAVMLGTLTPDLDQPTANLWRKMIGARTLGKIFQSFSGGHRHMTHSIIGIVAIYFFFRWMINNLLVDQLSEQASAVLVAYMVGYISHPIMDSLTDRGVPWFWPFHLHIKIPPGPEEMRVTTDSWVEKVIIRGGLVIIAFLLITTRWQTFLNFFYS